METVLGLLFLIGLVLWIVYMCVNYRELEEKRKAKLARTKEKQAEIRARQEELRKVQAVKDAERRKKYQIAEVKYLGSGTQTQKRGGLGGALLGGLVAGPLGAAVGAVIPENGDALQRFAVKYADDHVEIKELHPNNWEYKKLMKYVKWEDIK